MEYSKQFSGSAKVQEFQNRGAGSAFKRAGKPDARLRPQSFGLLLAGAIVSGWLAAAPDLRAEEAAKTGEPPGQAEAAAKTEAAAGAKEAPTDAKEFAAGPRMGKYLILSYGAANRPPLTLGYCVLEPDGKYKVFLPGDKPAGEGTYSYDAEKRTMTWKDGPYKEEGFGGEFTVDRGGKTHKLRLKRTTIATNSVE